MTGKTRLQTGAITGPALPSPGALADAPWARSLRGADGQKVIHFPITNRDESDTTSRPNPTAYTSRGSIGGPFGVTEA